MSRIPLKATIAQVEIARSINAAGDGSRVANHDDAANGLRRTLQEHSAANAVCNIVFKMSVRDDGSAKDFKTATSAPVIQKRSAGQYEVICAEARTTIGCVHIGIVLEPPTVDGG